MADNEKPLEPQVSAEAGKDKKEKESDGVSLPVLIEFTYTFSAIVLILLFLTMIGVSLLTGTRFLDILIRTGVTMLVIGGLLMLISRQISSGVLNASIVNEEPADQQPSEEEEFEGIQNHSPSEVQ